jgi:hypothetical protein
MARAQKSEFLIIDMLRCILPENKIVISLLLSLRPFLFTALASEEQSIRFLEEHCA